MNAMWIRAAALPLGWLAAATAWGDEVLFKSGDRLTGTVTKVEDGKMLFTSKVAGKLTLDLADIKTFATDAPVEIALKDGSVIRRQAAAAAEGTITVRGAEPAAAASALELATIDKINPDKPHWHGNVVAGALFARGNTRSDTANVTALATRRSENARTTLDGGYHFASQRDNATRDESTSADNWFARGKYDYFLSRAVYAYGTTKYEEDRIANLDRRVSPGVGLGYQWAERKDVSFLTEGGGSYVYEKYTDPDDTRTYMAARFAYQIEKSFSDSASVFHNAEYLPSMERLDTFLLNTDVGLRAKITERLLLEVKTQLAYNSQPAENRDKKDFRHTLGVGWTF